MDRKISQVAFAKAVPKLKKVAAYARVSTGKETMLQSLSAQISYYSSLIQSRPGWQYVGVYADEAKTGTKDSRENFQRLITDCRAGKIDMVITKSISRFARNTLTVLETVRELKLLGIDVFFEEQNIHSLSTDGELMLSILASFAQEESLSVSENMKWRICKNFEEGKPWDIVLYGYRYRDGEFRIVPEEAEVVKRIFHEYLIDGYGFQRIVNGLNEDGVLTRFGNAWGKTAIRKVLQNYTYTGNLLLQKTFRADHITKEKRMNQGELPMYHVTETHEPIIDMDTFNAVQEELQRRAEKSGNKVCLQKYPLSGKIVCGCCGKHYRHKITKGKEIWMCATFNTQGKKYCPSKQIPDSVLKEMTKDMDIGDLTEIVAENGNKLTFLFKNGEKAVKRWQDRSRSQSWTEEKREQARKRAKESL